MSLALELVLALAAVPCAVESCMSVVAGLDSNYLVVAVQRVELILQWKHIILPLWKCWRRIDRPTRIRKNIIVDQL